MLNFLAPLAGFIVILLLVALDANLKHAIARQNVIAPIGFWARLGLVLDALFGRLDWLSEHLDEQGLWYIDRTIRIRRLLMLVLAVYALLCVASATSQSGAAHVGL